LRKLALHTKLSSGLLAFIFLLSTFSFTAYKHYCGNILVETSLFLTAKNCCDNAMPVNCMENTANCCSNKMLQIQGQKDLKDAIWSVSQIASVGIADQASAGKPLSAACFAEVTSIKHLFPPPLQPIYLVNESFLI
tara:strand:- start:232 stop:639 length:408 start_codon:yes stop_codon:yes gene_type:complete